MIEVGISLPGTPAGQEMRFHRQRGSGVTVSADGLTASVVHANRDMDTAVVTSCRPLHDDELFEFRIDRVIETWSGSLEVGMCSLQT